MGLCAGASLLPAAERWFKRLQDDTWPRLAVLGAYAALVLARSPALVWPGRFWAEEGSVYFASAVTHPAWEVLTTPLLGYYSLYNLVAVLAAAHLVSLEVAPVVTVAFAFMAQLLPAWLILYALFPERRAAAVWAVALLLVILPNQEVWLNTINSQFYLATATAVILASGPALGRTRGVRLIALALAGLTGVVSCVLTPLFWIDAVWHRERTRVLEALVLSVALLIQLAAVLSGPGREGHQFVELIPFVLLSKQIVLVTLGPSALGWLYATVASARLFESVPAIVLASIPHLLLGTALFRWGGRAAGLLFTGSVLVACVSFMHSLDASDFEAMVGHVGPGAGRYYFAPNVMLVLAMLAAGTQPLQPSLYARAFRSGCTVFLSAATFVGATHYNMDSGFSTGPSWPTEVRKWRRGESSELAIWPRPWKTALPPELAQKSAPVPR